MMKGKNTGWIFAVFVSVCYLLMGLVFVTIPEYALSGSVAKQLEVLYNNRAMAMLNFISAALAGVFAVGAVPAITSYFIPRKSCVLIWGEKLGVVGYTILAITYFRAMTIKPLLAEVFSSGSELFRNIIPTMDPWFLIAPNGIATHGFMGLWLILLNVGVIRTNERGRTIGAIGVILGVAQVTGCLVASPVIASISIAVSSTFSCIWFLLVGIKIKNHPIEIQSDKLVTVS